MVNLEIPGLEGMEDIQDVLRFFLDALRRNAYKYGRVVIRQIMELIFVVRDGDLDTKDKLMVIAAIALVLVPNGAGTSSRFLKVLGLAGDALALSFVYTKLQSYVTDSIRLEVDRKLDEWFGYEVTATAD